MKALVTGGAGFIGSHLVDALCARGDAVVVVDNLSTGEQRNLEPALANHDLDLIIEDVTDRRALGRIFEAESPEVVFHLAAQASVRISVTDPAGDAGTNVGGTINVLDSALEVGTKRVVFASTGGAVYGEGAGRKLPLGEDAECLPEAPYGVAKLAAEHYVELFHRTRGLSTISLRFGNVYGPRQDPLGEAGVIAIFCGVLRDGGRPTVYGTGEQTRDYLYVGDAIEAFLAAADNDAHGSINIGTGTETSVLDLVATLGEIGRAKAFKPQLAPHRKGEIEQIAIDPSRAAAELGWSAATGLREGLELTLSSHVGEPAR